MCVLCNVGASMAMSGPIPPSLALPCRRDLEHMHAIWPVGMRHEAIQGLGCCLAEGVVGLAFYGWAVWIVDMRGMGMRPIGSSHGD